MPYSFTGCRRRRLFVGALRQVWIATVLLAAAVAVTAYGLHRINGEMSRNSDADAKLLEALRTQIGQLRAYTEEVSERRALVEEVRTSNELLREQLRSLLDLIPDDTTLTRFEITPQWLLYAGVSRDPEGLRKKLQTALRGQYRLQRYLQVPIDARSVRFESRFVAERDR